MGKSEFVDADFLGQLSPEERRWYYRFVQEYYYGKIPKTSTKALPKIHPDAFITAINRSRNSARRDVYHRGHRTDVSAVRNVPVSDYHLYSREPEPTAQPKELKPRRLAKSGKRPSQEPKSTDRRLKTTKKKSTKKARLYGGVTLRTLRGLVGRIVNLVYADYTDVLPGLAIRTFPKIVFKNTDPLSPAFKYVLTVTDTTAYIEKEIALYEWEKIPVSKWFVGHLKVIDKMVKSRQLMPSDFGVRRV